ncbi:hypothetical protein JB92DRAFT_3148048 [Gautieria morchelliformis]|nr:hypothetical protein JB92DRAFT_3148048 [Gautieria morchelliformis]
MTITVFTPFTSVLCLRHTVWLCLLFLPFQVANDFKWYTIPGTAVAAFFYLGYIAASEEIEQPFGYDEVRNLHCLTFSERYIAAGDEIEPPFGYDENDLDLNLFCHEVVQVDLHTLMITPFPNAPTRSHHGDIEINEALNLVNVSLGRHHI